MRSRNALKWRVASVLVILGLGAACSSPSPAPPTSGVDKAESRVTQMMNEGWKFIQNNSFTEAQGKITGYVIVDRDVTKRKQTEEALREKERLLSEAQRIGQIGSWSNSLTTGTLQFSNEMYRLFNVF